jgi:hypothetical protein
MPDGPDLWSSLFEADGLASRGEVLRNLVRLADDDLSRLRSSEKGCNRCEIGLPRRGVAMRN